MSTCLQQPQPRLSEVIRRIGGVDIHDGYEVDGEREAGCFSGNNFRLMLVDESGEREHFDAIPTLRFCNPHAARNAASDWNKRHPRSPVVAVEVGDPLPSLSMRVRLHDNAGVAEVVTYRPVRILNEHAFIEGD
jgi:hypothetical protein